MPMQFHIQLDKHPFFSNELPPDQIEGNMKITVQRLAASHLEKSYNQSEHSMSKKDSFFKFAKFRFSNV